MNCKDFSLRALREFAQEMELFMEKHGQNINKSLCGEIISDPGDFINNPRFKTLAYSES